METTITLIRESINQIRINFKLILKTYLLVVGISMLCIIPVLIIGGIVALMRNNALVLSLGIAVVSVAFLFMSTYVQAWGFLATTLAVINKEPVMGAKHISKRAWGMVSKYWGIMLLTSLMVIGGIIPLVIPGIVLGVTLVMVMFVLMDEGIGGMDGIMRCRFYIKGNRWQLAGRYLLLLIIAGLIQLGLQELVKSSNVVIQIISILCLAITGIGSNLFIVAFGYRNYVWLKESKVEVVYDPQEARRKYKLIAVWGIVAIMLAIIIPIVILGSRA
jgi:hypothetical protein